MIGCWTEVTLLGKYASDNVCFCTESECVRWKSSLCLCFIS
jgi:hypothetical protein